MEDLLTQILNEIKGLSQRMDRLENKFDILESKVDRLESKVDRLESKVDQLESKVDQLESKVVTLEGKVDRLDGEVSLIKSDMGTKTQQDETIGIVKAIQHNSEILNARVEGLAISTVSIEALANLATKEDMNHLSAQIKVVSSHLFDHEVEIHKLKAVK